MRSVLIGASLLALSACATVSMIPGEVTVETSLTPEQSSLRAASDAYCDTLETNGWVSASNGLAGFAAVLLHGQSGETDISAAYLEALQDLEAGARMAQIAADAEDARSGLSAVTDEAEGVLESAGEEMARRDVTSFERALVRAQRASRTFAKARDTLAAEPGPTAAAEEAIERFRSEIDRARSVADDLAARYASLGETAI